MADLELEIMEAISALTTKELCSELEGIIGSSSLQQLGGELLSGYLL